MTLIKLPDHLVKIASASALDFSSTSSSGTEPSAKLSLNISAFNGNTTNFGGNRNGNK